MQHTPRRVAVAHRESLRETLNDLVQKEVIAPVTQPTQWVSSMVAVPKQDVKMCICLDPRELNMAIRREHCPLPTIEEIATRLYGAKLFTVLDAQNGFWHIRLDEDSPPSTPPSEDTGGSECRLGLVQPLKFFNIGCT